MRHPLVRSALYQAATGEQRREAHGALAGALAGLGDSDREAWHRAAAAEGPDPEVVAALELVGSRAERRGAYASALTAYERAAALSTLTAQRAALTLAAARNAWACGQTAHARTLLGATRELAEDPVLLSDIARLQGRMEVNIGSANDAHRIFTEAAHAVRDIAPARALEMAVAAAIMGTYGADGGARLAPGDIDTEVTETDSARTVCLKHMLVAMTRADEGDWAGAVAALDLALGAGEELTDLDVLGNLGNAALQLGDEQAQQHFYTVALSRSREAGAAMAVVYALQRLCFGYLVAGDWAAVRASAEEALALGESMGQPALTVAPLAWLTLLAALQGREDYDTLLADLEKVAAVHPQGILTDPVHDLTRWAKGAHAAAAADNFGALHHLSQLRVPALARMAACERIDAAVRAGEPDLARRWVGELTEFAAATGRAWALAAVAYGQAMTDDDLGDPAASGDSNADGATDQTEQLFVDALQYHADAAPRLRPRSDSSGVRGMAAPLPASRRLTRAPAPCAGDVQRPARRPARRTLDRGTARLRRDRPQTRRLHPGEADSDGAQGRPAGGLGHVEQGRRCPDLGLTAHRGVPPAQRVREGRRHLTRRARPARPQLVERELCAVEVVVPGTVGVDVSQSHRVGEERVPVDWEVHPQVECRFGLTVEVAVQRVDGAVELPGQTRPVEHERAADATQVVDVVERPSAGVEHRREGAAERVG